MEKARSTTLIEGYLRAWSEADPAARIKLLEMVWNIDGTYTDPRSFAANRDQLHAIIGNFLKTNHGAKFSLKGDIDSHHQYVRFYWTVPLASGIELAGMDYGEVGADGSLIKIVGFV